MAGDEFWKGWEKDVGKTIGGVGAGIVLASAFPSIRRPFELLVAGLTSPARITGTGHAVLNLSAPRTQWGNLGLWGADPLRLAMSWRESSPYKTPRGSPCREPPSPSRPGLRGTLVAPLDDSVDDSVDDSGDDSVDDSGDDGSGGGCGDATDSDGEDAAANAASLGRSAGGGAGGASRRGQRAAPVPSGAPTVSVILTRSGDGASAEDGEGASTLLLTSGAGAGPATAETAQRGAGPGGARGPVFSTPTRGAAVHPPAGARSPRYPQEKSYAEACEDLAVLVSEAAGVERGDAVVDVGFGCGDQAATWARRYALTRYAGLNPCAAQVAVARRMLEAAHAAGQLPGHCAFELHEVGSEELSAVAAESGPFDRVLSLDAAYHFRTRRSFLTDAHAVLRPGGTVAVADIVPDAHRLPQNPFLRSLIKIGLWFASVPTENWHDVAAYRVAMEQAGFIDVRVKVIDSYVFTPFADFVRDTPVRAWVDSLKWARFALAASAIRLAGRGKLHFVIATGRKPDDPDRSGSALLVPTSTS